MALDKWLPIVFFTLLFDSFSVCDIYMHNSRGSNNRLNEDGREVKNNQRLFDSQNNNRGGYNVGHIYYLVGSKLQIEWTAQHSCADQNNNCEMIIQYMCSKNLRDGASTQTIPESNTQCLKNDCSTDIRYGMHEDNDYYLRCKARERNRGLYIADQNLRGKNRAINTRQNLAGKRYGYECPEERDYYPYWYYSPWKDIAVLTNNASRCKFYQKESANVKSRWECRASSSVLQRLIQQGKTLPKTLEACVKFNGTWTESPAHGIPAPECREPEWTRDNQLGNTISGYSPSFNWTIPSGENPNHLCALRIRYNISTSDYNGWNTFSSGPKADDFGSKFGFPSASDANARGFNVKQNPKVKPFSGVAGSKLELQLAVNTAQFGRTFEDRSHGFFIKPTTVKGTIYNINVRGKRGNIVQVYPSVEYDFTPNTLHVSPNEYIHFQWTGSNTNNRNNDGQGVAGSDRNNVLLQAASAYDEVGPSYAIPVYGRWGRSYPQHTTGTLNTSFMGFTTTDLEQLAFSGTVMVDVAELNDARTYFDLGPRKITSTGVTHYMCTRNNNFSNRSQKGRIFCSTDKVSYHNVGSNGGVFKSDDGSLTIQVLENVFSSLVTFRIEKWSRKDGEKRLEEKNVKAPSGDGYSSDFYVIGFSKKLAGKINVTMTVLRAAGVSVYRGNPNSLTAWERLVTNENSATSVSFLTNKDGVFVARYHNVTNYPLIVAMTVLGVLLIAGIVAAVFIGKRRGFFNNFTSKV